MSLAAVSCETQSFRVGQRTNIQFGAVRELHGRLSARVWRVNEQLMPGSGAAPTPSLVVPAANGGLTPLVVAAAIVEAPARER